MWFIDCSCIMHNSAQYVHGSTIPCMFHASVSLRCHPWYRYGSPLFMHVWTNVTVKDYLDSRKSAWFYHSMHGTGMVHTSIQAWKGMHRQIITLAPQSFCSCTVHLLFICLIYVRIAWRCLAQVALWLIYCWHQVKLHMLTCLRVSCFQIGWVQASQLQFRVVR